MELIALLKQAVQLGASDLHLSSGASPAVRVDGVLHFLPQNPLHSDDLEQGIWHLTDESMYLQFQEKGQVDFAVTCEAGRFRVNVFQTLHGVAAAFRCIPSQIPDLSSLGLPEKLIELSQQKQGLVLITGATGSGKSTTLAALIDYINKTEQKHILTLEDPIEFVHRNQQSLINQREVGRNTLSFADGLRSALREDPDIILLGEMRDCETISLALTAAETGHLVFATLHSNSAADTVDRVIDVFAAEEKNLVRTMLANCLNSVVAQTLIPRIDGKGRIAACEILYSNAAVRNLIRENKTAQLHSIMQTGAAYGMQTMAQSMAQLQAQGLIASQNTMDFSALAVK